MSALLATRLRSALAALALVAPAMAPSAGTGTPAAFAPAGAETPAVADVRHALVELEKACGHFFETKGIDWKAVSKQFEREAEEVQTDQDELVLLVRLLARLEDGHAEVRPIGEAKDVRWPDEPERTGAGMFWCRSGKKILVKSTWNAAADSGLQPGWEVVKVAGVPVQKWLDARIAELRDRRSFSTDQQAFFHACSWGLAEPVGTRLELELKDERGKPKKRTVEYTKAAIAPWGPAFFPDGLEGDDDVRWGRTKKGWGYLHLRRCPGDLPEKVDQALAEIGDAKGLIVDFRANGGGSFDHEAFLGRFVPAGKTMDFGLAYASAGPNPYGGPIVVIVDGNCRSAGETGAGIFKEDGRAYMIGESPTAGMSSHKTTLKLPSGRFELYVSTASNKHSFNGGRGIEGIGVEPHEIVEYDALDLAEGVDTLTARAEELLARFPSAKVAYDPKAFGWKR